MHGFSLKKMLACLLVAGATFALWYGASRFRFTPEEIAQAQAETEQQNHPQAEETAEEEKMPQAAPPAPDDIAGRIASGDFSVLRDAPVNTLRMLESVYGDTHAQSRFPLRDVTGDGVPELLWVVGIEDTRSEAVIAAFVPERDAAKMILFDPETADDYYAAGADGLVYIRKNEWIISEFHCTNVLFDRAYELYAGDGIFLYIVSDETAYNEGVDAALRRRMEDVSGKGVWYYALQTGLDAEQAERIDASDWLDRFSLMTGTTLLYAAPEIEELRSGVEAGVARKSYVVRRAHIADDPYEEAVYYPQITEGDKLLSVNNVLRDAAFDALVKDYTNRRANETPEDYLQRMKADASVSRTAESSFRLMTDTDALLSVLYRARRGTNGVFDKTEISFLTIDKSTGRQLQIGDMAGADTIARAVANGDAELFYASGDDIVFERDDDISRDVNRMNEIFAETRAAGDVWKKAGLDEQFLFIVVTPDAETGSEAILRIPRWKVGMSTPGHMELLTWHEAFAYLRGFLDMATSLTVRKDPGGYLIGYRTDEGGQVTLKLRESTRTLPEGGLTPELYRDYYAGEYEDMSAFATGSFETDGDRRESGEFFAVELNRGADGFIFLRIGENRYEIRQTCVNTRGGAMPIRLKTQGASLLKTSGSLYTDSFGAGTWHNYETGFLTLTRRITLEDMYAFTLVPGTGSSKKDTFGQLEIRAGGDGEPEVFPVRVQGEQYVFRDINHDGYPDFTVGQVKEEDHAGEHNFFYHPDLARFVEGPKILEGKAPYSFDAETGYALVGDPESEVTLYAFDGEGAFSALRSMTASLQENGATHMVIRAEDEVLLDDMLRGEKTEEAQMLFRSEILWQGDLDAGTKGRLIVTKRNSSDIIQPLETVRFFFIDKRGRLAGYAEREPTKERLLHTEADGLDSAGALSEESTILLRYAAADGEGEEQIVSVTVRELLTELKQ